MVEIINMFVKLLQQKNMQNHLIRIFVQDSFLDPKRDYEIGPDVVIWSCPDLPRPVQEDKSLSTKQAFFRNDKLLIKNGKV